MLRRSALCRVAPVGAAAPALNLKELAARTPRARDFQWRFIFDARKECYYQPEAMAHFKDPQQYKDAIDTAREMQTSDKFWGDGMKPPRHVWGKIAGILLVCWLFSMALASYFYGRYLPTNNPSWRKCVNKEWEEAINNSPWDHRTHVWAYCDVYAASIGDLLLPGQRKFYIPA